ncbi:hypothetical protein [Yinghuangia sp. YIM S10712]|uniref:hypothetical protein n=1 Tax=Yinghuangia sp. YIM S10712 TaxID=3436930 RepID=UPI003F5385B8
MVTTVVRPPATASRLRVPVRRVVRGARTTPGRWAVTGVLLVVVALLAGVFAFASVRERAAAADRVATSSEPLGVRTQELYRALAQANATAAAGLLSGGVEKKEVREEYAASLDSAQRTLMSALSAGSSGRIGELLSGLSVEIPRYREDVARAKAAARQGNPLGAAYLRVASRQMEEVILPAADELHAIAADRLRADQREATAVPWAAVAVALGSLAGLVVAQVLLARRTKRVFNPGLLVAGLSVAALTGWTVLSLAAAGDALRESRDDGWRPVDALSQARFSLLQARAAEGQILVQHGSDGGKYSAELDARFAELTRVPDGRLNVAAELSADDATTAAKVAEARAAVADWIVAHGQVMEKYNATQFSAAVDLVIQPDGAAQVAFVRAERALADAIAEDQADFVKAVGEARDTTDGAAVGALVLAVVAAAGIVDGIRRRVGEYR